MRTGRSARNGWELGRVAHVLVVGCLVVFTSCAGSGSFTQQTDEPHETDEPDETDEPRETEEPRPTSESRPDNQPPTSTTPAVSLPAPLSTSGPQATLPIATAPPVVQPGSTTASGPTPTAVPSAPAGALPEFLTAGTRITWYLAAASVAQSRFSIVEDPACAAGGPGCYTDPTTGKSYRKSDEGPTATGAASASGDGYAQIDVVAVDGTDVSVSMNNYVIDRTFNQLSWAPIGGGTVNGVSVPGAWLNPTDLARAAETGIAGILVLVGVYTFYEQLIPSISFVTGLGTNTYQSYTYDRVTGLLLASSSSTGGPTTSFSVDGMPTPVTGNTQLTLTRLVDLRQRDVPGQTGSIPSWVSQTNGLRYAGTYNITNPVDPSSGSFDYPMEHAVTFGARGESWVSYTSRTVVPAMGQDTSAPGVGGPAGLYWWDPQALAAMLSGQELDADAATGERLVVSYRGAGVNGAEVVVIDSLIPSVSTRATYDMTGLLVAYQVQLASTGATISLALV